MSSNLNFTHNINSEKKRNVLSDSTAIWQTVDVPRWLPY